MGHRKKRNPSAWIELHKAGKMGKGLVTVFGGNGTLGRFVLPELVKNGWRIRVAVRRPHTAQDLRVIGAVGQIQLVQANLRYRLSVARAIEGADAVVNLVGIPFKRGRQTFNAVHYLGVQAIAETARAEGVGNIVHISALGAGENAPSAFLRSKTDGESALLKYVPNAKILRPSLIFGENDGFFCRFASDVQWLPALPLIGGGHTKFQPVYVGDIAEAVKACLAGAGKAGIYELGGPNTYSFRQLLDFVLHETGKRRFLIPLPWFIGRILGRVGEVSSALPFVKPFLTRDQVESLTVDNVVSGDYPGLSDLGVKAETIEALMPTHLASFRKYGQFYKKAGA